MEEILIIEDDISMQQSLKASLQKEKFRLFFADKAEKGKSLFEQARPDLVLLDLHLPDYSGRELFEELREIDESTPILIITAYPDMRGAIALMKAGAFDYMVKPFDLVELKLQIKKALQLRDLKRKVDTADRNAAHRKSDHGLLGESGAIREVKRLIEKVASSDSTVLIQGESGTGKELVARAIHELSPRKDGSLVFLNCAAIPENLLESELFGYEKGAFTGAEKMKVGLFELAHKGTLFLDEIGEMSIGLQAKLLRSLENFSIKRVGGDREIHLDARVIAATNQSFRTLIDSGLFRQDLYFRLNVFPIHLPSLRKREGDIALLARYFLDTFANKAGLNAEGISPAALEVLENYNWPGNVRELKNILERIVLILAEGKNIPLLQAESLPAEIRNPTLQPSLPVNEAAKTPLATLEEVETAHIAQVLRSCDGNKSEAARILGVSRNTLSAKLKKND